MREQNQKKKCTVTRDPNETSADSFHFLPHRKSTDMVLQTCTFSVHLRQAESCLYLRVHKAVKEMLRVTFSHLCRSLYVRTCVEGFLGSRLLADSLPCGGSQYTELE